MYLFFKINRTSSASATATATSAIPDTKASQPTAQHIDKTFFETHHQEIKKIFENNRINIKSVVICFDERTTIYLNFIYSFELTYQETKRHLAELNNDLMDLCNKYYRVFTIDSESYKYLCGNDVQKLAPILADVRDKKSSTFPSSNSHLFLTATASTKENKSVPPMVARAAELSETLDKAQKSSAYLRKQLDAFLLEHKSDQETTTQLMCELRGYSVAYAGHDKSMTYRYAGSYIHEKYALKADQKESKAIPPKDAKLMPRILKTIPPFIEAIDQYLRRQKPHHRLVKAKALLCEIYGVNQTLADEKFKTKFKAAYTHLCEAYSLTEYAYQMNTAAIPENMARILAELRCLETIILYVRETTGSTLDLANHGLEDDQIVVLAEELRVHPHITALNLSQNNIGDIGGAALATLTTIHTLNLYRNNIRHSAEALAKSTIKDLDLSDTFLDDAAGKALATYSNQLTLDVSINLDCGLTPETEAAIKAKIAKNKALQPVAHKTPPPQKCCIC